MAPLSTAPSTGPIRRCRCRRQSQPYRHWSRLPGLRRDRHRWFHRARTPTGFAPHHQRKIRRRLTTDPRVPAPMIRDGRLSPSDRAVKIQSSMPLMIRFPMIFRVRTMAPGGVDPRASFNRPGCATTPDGNNPETRVINRYVPAVLPRRRPAKTLVRAEPSEAGSVLPTPSNRYGRSGTSNRSTLRKPRRLKTRRLKNRNACCRPTAGHATRTTVPSGSDLRVEHRKSCQ